MSRYENDKQFSDDLERVIDKEIAESQPDANAVCVCGHPFSIHSSDWLGDGEKMCSAYIPVVTMTDLERDAKLAEAIGCKPVWEKWNRDSVEAWHCECMALNYVHGDKRRQAEIHTYYSAPTWETSGQLIEGLAARGWEIEMQQCSGFAICRIRNQAGVVVADLNAGTVPKAITLAACKALGIETEEE